MSKSSQIQRRSDVDSDVPETRHTRRTVGIQRVRLRSIGNHQPNRSTSRRYVSARIDWPVLHWLLRCPFLSTEDLAAFCGLSHSTMARRLRELEEFGLVEWVTPACLVHSGVRRLYHLSNVGINLVAASVGIDASKLARIWDCDERRLLHQVSQLPHMLRVQSLVRGLLMGAPQALSEQGHEASGGWHWMRNYSHSFSFHNHSQMLRLDAVLVFHVTRVSVGGHVADTKSSDTLNTGSRSSFKQSHWVARNTWYAALLLADAPVQDWRTAARMLDALLSYRESPERWSVYDQFPPLLLLAENVRHVERWHHLARACADLRQLPPLRGAIAIVAQPPNLPQSFDSWRLPWRDLATGVPCHLTQVMPRLSHDAVLPKSDGSDSPRPLSVRKRVITAPQPQARIVVGGFTDRALSVASEQSQFNVHIGTPRESLRLLSLQLGSRLTEILTELLRVPGIQVVDLANLLGMQLSSVDRYLSVLDRYGLLRHFMNTTPSIGDKDGSFRAIRQNHLSYDPSTSVWLSDTGLCLAAASQRMSPRSQLARNVASRRPRHDEDVWTPTAHNVGVYHFFALLARAAAVENHHLPQESMQSPRHDLVWWEVGMLAERRYRYQGRWHSLRPDGAGCYQTGATRFRFWLEWDQGSMNLADLIRKFISYYTYLASGAWREASNRVIPHLLIVTQDFGQVRRMRTAAAIASADDAFSVNRSAGAMLLKVSITLASRLEESGPLAPIWWPLLPPLSSPQSTDMSQSTPQASQLISAQRIFP